MRLLENPDSSWNALIQQLPQAHILQTWEWGQSKIKNGWLPSHYVWEDAQGKPIAAAMVLKRTLSPLPGLSVQVLYCPKGPTLDWSDSQLAATVLDDLQTLARHERAVFIKMDPDIPLGWGQPGSEGAREALEGLAIQQDLQSRGWVFSADQIQFRNTVVIPLDQPAEQLLAEMKQKTRYNIRLSERKGVTVRRGVGADLPLLYQMYAATAVRDDFVIRHEEYYTALWAAFMQAGLASLLIAEVEGSAVAALVLFHFAGVSRYMFGMSTEAHRDWMPSYLLQWEAILLSKELGCHSYDMWGAPDVFDESDSMWGVYRFKGGFNGITTRHIGAWDYTPRPKLYRLYTQTLPKVLDVMRRRGKAQNRKRSTT